MIGFASIWLSYERENQQKWNKNAMNNETINKIQMKILNYGVNDWKIVLRIKKESQKFQQSKSQMIYWCILFSTMPCLAMPYEMQYIKCSR